MPVLAVDRVRFVGERVAVVGAESADIAEEALSRIEVDYEELPAVHDPLKAMAAGAPIVHDGLRNYEGLQLPLPEIPNLHSYVEWRKGNLEAGAGRVGFCLRTRVQNAASPPGLSRTPCGHRSDRFFGTNPDSLSG